MLTFIGSIYVQDVIWSITKKVTAWFCRDLFTAK